MKKLIIGLFLIYSLPIFSQELVLTDAVNEVPVGYSCEVFQDETQRFSEKDILTQHFNASNSSIPNFGYGTAAIWLKINVQNLSSKHWLLEIDNPRTNHLSVYVFQKNQLIEQIHTGDSQPFSSYLFPDRNLIFDLKMHQDESYTIYLKARGTEDLKFPMTGSASRATFVLFGFVFNVG